MRKLIVLIMITFCLYSSAQTKRYPTTATTDTATWCENWLTGAEEYNITSPSYLNWPTTWIIFQAGTNAEQMSGAGYHIFQVADTITDNTRIHIKGSTTNKNINNRYALIQWNSDTYEFEIAEISDTTFDYTFLPSSINGIGYNYNDGFINAGVCIYALTPYPNPLTITVEEVSMYEYNSPSTSQPAICDDDNGC